MRQRSSRARRRLSYHSTHLFVKNTGASRRRIAAPRACADGPATGYGEADRTATRRSLFIFFLHVQLDRHAVRPAGQDDAGGRGEARPICMLVRLTNSA